MVKQATKCGIPFILYIWIGKGNKYPDDLPDRAHAGGYLHAVWGRLQSDA